MHKLNSFIVKLTIFSLVLGMFVSLRPTMAQAVGGLTSMKDFMSTAQTNLNADHEIMFNTVNGVASGQTIVVTFPSDFDGSIAGGDGILEVGDVDLIKDTTQDGTCEDQAGAGEALVASGATASQWNVVFSGTQQRTLTFTSGGASATFAAAHEVCIEIGEQADGTTNNYNALTPPAPSNAQYKNATTTGTKLINVTAGTADSGTLAVSMTDSSTVVLSASVDATLTFDIDTSTSDGNSNSPYTVALGTLAAGTLTTSNQSSINSIFFDLDTNASGGAQVGVRGLNGGLRSPSTNPPRTFNVLSGGEANFAAGTEGVGLCVESVAATTGTLNKGGTYDSDGQACSLTNTGTQRIGQINTTFTQILFTAAPMAAGRGEVLVKASITATTPAANDYAETLTFIATGTF